jgi:hypothetical protein
MQSQEFEQAVLGGLLLDSASLIYCGDLVASDFFDRMHGQIFGAVVALHSAGQVGDVISVFEHLKNRDIGVDLVDLHALAQYVPSASAIKGHAAKIRDLAVIRNMAAILDNPTLSPSEISDRITMLAEGVSPKSATLDYVMADSLPDEFTPRDELVEGVLTAGDGSVLYGDTNTGKTFLVIDIASCVARGVPWMGKHTEPGMVVYLAAESPSSVRDRLSAYQRHHGCKVPNFAIVQSPIDLFDGNADTNKVIKLVHQLERQHKQKVRLIVGDTLARLSAGANENAGQDMGLVVRRFDRIRTEAQAHFMLVHHCGKVAAAGARGWSGVRAAVDTEIEISESPAGRCVEITKQRDLNTKGERIGFRLDSVTMGLTKWGMPATSCIVVSTNAPVKAGKAIKLGETQQAVIALLRGADRNMRIREIADKLAIQDIARTSVYNAVNRLRDVELVEVSGGVVHLIGGKA